MTTSPPPDNIMHHIREWNPRLGTTLLLWRINSQWIMSYAFTQWYPNGKTALEGHARFSYSEILGLEGSLNFHAWVASGRALEEPYNGFALREVEACWAAFLSEELLK